MTERFRFEVAALRVRPAAIGVAQLVM